MDYITYEDFKKLDMRVGLIKFVEPVPDTDKLLRFEIDFGLKPKSLEETGSPDPTPEEGGLGEERDIRQIVSGIHEFYPDYEQLVGKYALYVVNLEPRTIKGVESHGMLMAVDGLDGQPVFMTPEKPVQPGSKIR